MNSSVQSLGGPIIKDNLHFFVTYEGKRQIKPVDDHAAFGRHASIRFPIAISGLVRRLQQGLQRRSLLRQARFRTRLVPICSNYPARSAAKAGLDDQQRPVRADDRRPLSRNNETRVLFHYQHTADAWLNDLKVEWQKIGMKSDAQRRTTCRMQFFTGPRSGDRPAQCSDPRLWRRRQLPEQGSEGLDRAGRFHLHRARRQHDQARHQGAVAEICAPCSRPRTTRSITTTPTYPDDGDGFNDTTPYQLQFGVPVEGLQRRRRQVEGFPARPLHPGRLGSSPIASPRTSASAGIMSAIPIICDYVTPPDVVSALRNWSNLDNADL